MAFTDRDRKDLQELFRIYDFSKVNKVDQLVAEAEGRGMTPAAYFDDLFNLYKIKRLPNREDAKGHLLEAVPMATDEDVESVLRLTEMQRFAEKDAIRSLERQYKIARTSRPPSRPAGTPGQVLPPIPNRVDNPGGTNGAAISQPAPPDSSRTPPSVLEPVAAAHSAKATPTPGSQKLTPPRDQSNKASSPDSLNSSSPSHKSSNTTVPTSGHEGTVSPSCERESHSELAGAGAISVNLPAFSATEERDRDEGVGKDSAGDAVLGDSADGQERDTRGKTEVDRGGQRQPTSAMSPHSQDDTMVRMRRLSRLAETSVNGMGGPTSAEGHRTLSFRRRYPSFQRIHPGADGEPALLADPNMSTSLLSAPFSREAVDEVMAEEIRDWVAAMVGPTFNGPVLSSSNFVDALRNGVILSVLLQKMENPPVPEDKIKVPKRTTGFFARDNVASFLAEVKKRFRLVDAQMFSNSDLCDGKDDRQVVTCLMAMARIAYSQGAISIAPTVVVLEKEIETRAAKLMSEEMDRIVQEALRREQQGDKDTSMMREPSSISPLANPATPHEAGKSQQEDTAATSHDRSAAEESPDEDDAGEPSSAEEGEEASGGVEERTDASGLPEDEESEEAGAHSDDEESTERKEDKSTPAETAAADTTNNDAGTAFPQLRGAAEQVGQPVAFSTGVEPADNADSVSEDRVVQDKDTQREHAEAFAHSGAPLHHPISAQESCEPQPRDGNSGHPGRLSSGKEDEEKRRSESAPGVRHDASAEEPPEASRDDECIGADGLVVKRKGEWNSKIEEDSHADEKPAPRTNVPKRRPTRVVWKVPKKADDKTNGQAPRYRSRRWDGIDVALGNIVNEHYAAFPECPWRFHAVAANAGEYVMYNRDTAQKKVIFIRFIQRRLFVRYSQRSTGPEWVLFVDAIHKLDELFARQPP